MLTRAVNRNNQRIGVEIVPDSDSSSESLDESDLSLEVPNTREFQRDFEFAKNYFYITDVRYKIDHKTFIILYFQLYWSLITVRMLSILFGRKG